MVDVDFASSFVVVLVLVLIAAANIYTHFIISNFALLFHAAIQFRFSFYIPFRLSFNS